MGRGNKAKAAAAASLVGANDAAIPSATAADVAAGFAGMNLEASRSGAAVAASDSAAANGPAMAGPVPRSPSSGMDDR